MNGMNDKISIRQAFIIVLAFTYSPFMRSIPYFTAKQAKQAAWLAPLLASLILLLAVFIFQGIYKKYTDKEMSFMDILYDVFGKWIGKALVLTYFIFTTILLCYYTRYYCERLVATTYYNVDIKLFLVSMLVFIAFVMRFKLVIFARMSEIIFLVLLLIFFILSTLNIPNIELHRITPISISDFFPVVKAGIGVSSGYLLFSYIFLVSDKINKTDKIKKYGLELVIFYTIVIPILVITVIGVLNYSTVERSTIPYLVAIKHISLFQTIEKIESLVVGIWILSDFALLYFFSYANIHILKSLFGLKEPKHLNNIYLTFVGLFTLTLAVSKFELEDFEQLILMPVGIVFGFGIPVLTYAVGKMRKKV